MTRGCCLCALTSLDLSSFATQSGATLVLIEHTVPYKPKILYRTYSIVLTTRNVTLSTLDLSSFATQSGATLILIEHTVPSKPKILCRTYSIVQTTRNVTLSHHDAMNKLNKMKIRKKNKQNKWYILSKPYALLLELYTAIRVFTCLQNIDNSDALHPLPNCLDGLKEAALFKFYSFLFKTTLLSPCRHVSKCFFSVMSCSSWVDSWLYNLFLLSRLK